MTNSFTFILFCGIILFPLKSINIEQAMEAQMLRTVLITLVTLGVSVVSLEAQDVASNNDTVVDFVFGGDELGGTDAFPCGLVHSVDVEYIRDEPELDLYGYHWRVTEIREIIDLQDSLEPVIGHQVFLGEPTDEQLAALGTNSEELDAQIFVKGNEHYMICSFEVWLETEFDAASYEP